MPATEEAVVDIVAFCYEEEKGGDNFEEKHVYIESEKGREKSAEAKRYECFSQVHDIHKYFDKITVRCVVCFVCPTYHHFISF